MATEGFFFTLSPTDGILRKRWPLILTMNVFIDSPDEDLFDEVVSADDS